MGVYWVTARHSGSILGFGLVHWHMVAAAAARTVWILRGGLAFIGLVGAGVFLWFHRKNKRAQSDAEGESPAGGNW